MTESFALLRPVAGDHEYLFPPEALIVVGDPKHIGTGPGATALLLGITVIVICCEEGHTFGKTPLVPITE